MEKDKLISEMTKWAAVARAPDPALELDIHKVLESAVKQANLPPEEVQAIEKILRQPESAVWTEMPPLPEEPLLWEPNQEQIDFFKNLIRVVADGAEWEVPRTGQKYKINKENRTFTLTKDVEHDQERWHDKNKMILGLLGWRMVDERTSTHSFSTRTDNWIVAVFDFSIATQIDSRTGTNYPPGTRGQDAMATNAKGAVIRLSQKIGAHLWKHISKPAQTHGIGKTSAPGQAIKNYGQRDKKP